MTGYQKRLALRFGSLVIHDNTYKSNLWLYHLGLFTVVNEHGVSMIAAQALTLRETEEDYIFQYTQWLKAVGFLWGIIYTDCAIAVLNALAFIVNAVGGTGGNHFWCRWHMVQAMIRNLKAGWWQQHERAFYWCVYQADPTTFELAWGLFLAGQKKRTASMYQTLRGGQNKTMGRMLPNSCHNPLGAVHPTHPGAQTLVQNQNKGLGHPHAASQLYGLLP